MSKEILRELSPKFYFVYGEQEGRYPYCNGLLIDSGLKVIVDAGFGRRRCAALQETRDVDVIINTHYHLDHAFGNRFFPKAKIWAHVLDAPALRSQKDFLAHTGFDSLKFPEGYPFPEGMLGRAVERELVDGETLDFGNVELQVLHTPGHTPGHISLYEPKERILFSGDIDLSPFGPWYGNASSSLEEFSASIRRLIELKPQVLLTCHSDMITDNIPERLREYEEKLNQREEKILQNLRVPLSKQELMEKKIIYQRYPEPQSLYQYFEEVMLEKHLQRLMKLGKISFKTNQKYKAYA